MESSAARRASLSGAAVGPVLTGMGTALELVVAVVIARVSGPAAVGDLGLALAASGVVGLLAGFQLETQAARSADLRWCTAAVPWAFVASALNAGLLLLAGLLLGALGETTRAATFLAVLPGAAVQPLLGLARGALAVGGKERVALIPATLRPVLRLAGLLGLAALPTGQNVGAPALALALTVADVALAIIVGRAAWRLRTAGVPSRAIVANILRSFPPLLLSSTMWAAILRMDVIAVSAIVSSEAAGRYLLAVRLGEIPMQLFSGAMLTYLPAGAIMASTSEICDLYRRVTRATTVLLLPLCVGAAVWGDQLVAWAFGRSFVLPVPVYAVVALGAFVHVASGPTGATLVAQRRHKELAVTAVAVTCAGLISNVLLVSLWGVLGAALASTLTLAAVNSAYLAWSAPTLGLSRRSWRYPGWLLLALFVVAAVQTMARAASGASLWGAAVAGALGLGSALACGRLSPRTWAAIRDVWTAARAGVWRRYPASLGARSGGDS